MSCEKFFEPGESLEFSSTKRVDIVNENGALVMRREVAKAGRKMITEKSNGLIQARIEELLSLSGKKVVNKGRMPKRKLSKVRDNKESASNKQNKK